MQHAVIHAKQTVHSCSCVGLDPCITIVILAFLILQSCVTSVHADSHYLKCLLVRFGKTQMEQLKTYETVERQRQRNTVGLPSL